MLLARLKGAGPVVSSRVARSATAREAVLIPGRRRQTDSSAAASLLTDNMLKQRSLDIARRRLDSGLPLLWTRRRIHLMEHPIGTCTSSTDAAKGIDYAKSFEPVVLIGFGDSVLTVHPALPVNSVKELIALAKKRPGELNYSSSGIGGFPHMNTELFKLMTGTNIVHVPFQGGGPAAVDTMAGNTQMNLGSIPSLIGHIRGGKLKPLGVGGKKRNVQLPNVPTMSEAGVPGYVTYIWWAIFAPLKTSPDAIRAMHAQVMTSLDSPDLLPRLEAQGVEIQKTSPAELGKLMAEETKKWADGIRRADIKGE